MSDSLPKQKKLIPISEAAKILGVSIDTVRRWDKSGVLHSERPDGKNRYFSLDELEKYKVSQPLSISEVAEKVGISSTTLRRLEERGLIKPKRNSAGERVYDEELLENFLNSDYFLRKKQIKEKILEPFQEEKELVEIPNIRLSLRPKKRINEFITASFTIFALLFAIGIRSIWINEYKSVKPLSSRVSQVLSVAKEVKPQISEATSEAKPKTTLTVKLDKSSSYVNIRQKPTTKSAKIGQAKNGDTFEFISEDSDWFEVKIASTSGFISAEYIEEGN